MAIANIHWHSPLTKLIIRQRITPKTHSHFHSSMINKYQKHYKKTTGNSCNEGVFASFKATFLEKKNGPRHLQGNQKMDHRHQSKNTLIFTQKWKRKKEKVNKEYFFYFLFTCNNWNVLPFESLDEQINSIFECFGVE